MTRELLFVAPVDRSKTITRDQPRVENEVLTAIDSSTLEDSFVYVHCYFNNPSDEMLIRIWKTTFLVDYATGNRSALVHAENISMAPQWTMIPGGTTFHFLLIFNALPGGCKLFTSTMSGMLWMVTGSAVSNTALTIWRASFFV